MRILTISNMEGGTDPVVEAFNTEGVSIIAKEISGDVKKLGDVASEYLSHGKYDIIVVVPDDPIAASMLFNKYSNLTAALCSTVTDAQLASNNGANTLILKDANARNLDQMVSIIANSSATSGKEQRQEKREPIVQNQRPMNYNPPVPIKNKGPGISKQFMSGINKITDSAKSSMAPKPRSKAEETQEDEPIMPQGKREGVFGKLKDALGIIDDDKK